jgi:pimeloyl-ACP methyl ester carboxylesterase
VFAIDQRGFGQSGGNRCVIEKAEDVYNDQWLLIFEAIKRFKINQ